MVVKPRKIRLDAGTACQLRRHQCKSMERTRNWWTFTEVGLARSLLRHRVVLQDDLFRPALRPLLELRKGLRALTGHHP